MGISLKFFLWDSKLKTERSTKQNSVSVHVFVREIWLRENSWNVGLNTASRWQSDVWFLSSRRKRAEATYQLSQSSTVFMEIRSYPCLDLTWSTSSVTWPEFTVNKIQSRRECGIYGHTMRSNVKNGGWHKCDYWKSEVKCNGRTRWEVGGKKAEKNTVYSHWSMFTDPAVPLRFMRHSYVGQCNICCAADSALQLLSGKVFTYKTNLSSQGFSVVNLSS